MKNKWMTPVSCLVVGLTWDGSSGAVGAALPGASDCWENNQVVVNFNTAVNHTHSPYLGPHGDPTVAT